MTTIRDAFNQFLDFDLERLRPAMEGFSEWFAITAIVITVIPLALVGLLLCLGHRSRQPPRASTLPPPATPDDKEET